MTQPANSRLEKAKQALKIAESGDAKREAYKTAAEEIAAHKAETGDNNRVIAAACKTHARTIDRLLKWRDSGYGAQTPFLMDTQATTRASRSHAKSALRNPVERKQVLGSMSTTERAEIVRDVLDDETLATDEVRSAIVDEQERRDRQRRAQARAASDAALKPRPLSEHFWSVMGTMLEWKRNLAFITPMLGGLAPHQVPDVIKRHKELKEVIEQNLAILEPVDLPSADSDVIEGNVTPIRSELSA